MNAVKPELTTTCLQRPVASEIRELTNLLKNQNKNQEIHKHIWEFSEFLFSVIHTQDMINTRNHKN